MRAFSVLFVIFVHIQMPYAARFSQSPLRHFDGSLGVDVFFVLSGFLITGILLREEDKTGTIGMIDFYIRRAFRILPLYWVVLLTYVLLLQAPSQWEKWTLMKAALPYFLTFNNDIAELLMPQRVGSTFGLSWTLGIEEKFYFFWPWVSFIMFKSHPKRLAAAGALYGATLLGAVLCFPMGRAYSGLVVGAILSILLTGNKFEQLKTLIARIPAVGVLAALAAGFALVDIDHRTIFVFSWLVALLIAHMVLTQSWLSRFLSLPLLAWFGKRSYAMYLIQGFAINTVEFLRKPQSVFEEVLVTLGAFLLASLGAALLHRFVEEPARHVGKAISARRTQKRHEAVITLVD